MDLESSPVSANSKVSRTQDGQKTTPKPSHNTQKPSGLTPVELIFNVTIIAVLVIQWIYAIASIHMLPNTIPIHTTMTNTSDHVGNRRQILILPAMSTVLTVLYQLVAMNARKLKLAKSKNSTEDAERAQVYLRITLRYVNTMTVLVLLYDLIGWVRSVERYEDFGPATWIASIVGIGIAMIVSTIVLIKYIRS